MPLVELSPNIQDPETGRKRSHDEFSGEFVKVDVASEAKSSGDGLLHSVTHNPRPSHSSPQRSQTLKDANGSTCASTQSPKKQGPEQGPEQDSTTDPDAATSSSQPATTTTNTTAKRQRLTPAEKEAREKDLADKKKEREEKASIKAAEKAKQEEEKAARAKEREEKRKKKEEEDRQKAEKKQRIQDEKDRKARSQKTLNNFFKIPNTPKKAGAEAAANDNSPTKASSATSVAKQAGSEYVKLFKPFFVKDNTRLAPTTVPMDDETREAKSRSLDEHIASQLVEVLPFNPVDVFEFPRKPPRRGRLHEPVKHIMEMAYKETQNPNNTGGADASRIFKAVQQQLSKVPMKVIAFSQDVRPPYYGTVTFKTFVLGKESMQKLARRTMRRRLPLDYDYDSEAEWQEEEGEDLDVEDEEEELDDEDDMDGFLDDSEDVGLSRRVFGNVMEPESTGICFEDQSRQGPNPAVYENKMEFIHEVLEHHWGIDPFSTKYWEPEPKAAKAKTSKTAKSSESEAKMPPPPAPSNAFSALDGGGGPGKLVKAELMNDIKRAILDNKALSKVGIIDFIFHQFRDLVSRAEVKNTIEFVAEKRGAGRSKEWELKPGHDIVM